MNKQHKKPRCDDMYRAILTLKTVDECKQFFDDLCTVTELQAMEQRYQVAQYLDAGLIYNDILEKTGASSATISRVNRSLQYGTGGYEIVFGRLKEAATQECFISGGESKVLTFENTPLSAIIIRKVDSESGQPLEGAWFRIRYLGGTSGTGGTVVGEYKTSSNGTIVATDRKSVV